MDEYQAYLNVYRKELDGQPLCDAQKRSLLTFVKTFVQYMHRKGLLAENSLASIELPSRGFQLPKALLKWSSHFGHGFIVFPIPVFRFIRGQSTVV